MFSAAIYFSVTSLRGIDICSMTKQAWFSSGGNLQAGSRPDVSSGVCERGRTQLLEPPDLYLSDPRTVITVVISTLPCQSIQFVFLLAENHVLHVVAVRYDFYYNFHASKSLILLFLVICSYRTLSLSTENTLMFSMPANHKRTCRR